MRRTGILLLAVTVACAAIALWLFPRALPTLELDQRLTAETALQQADSFFRAHDLAPQGARTAVRFSPDDSLLTYIELGAGGKDTLDALLRSGDVVPFAWSVRAFVPDDPHEARASLAPDGRVTGFQRRFAESDTLPALTQDSARARAQAVLFTWLRQPADRWRFLASSYETVKTSGRIDHTFTFERSDRRVGDAPLRMDIVVAGDQPAGARPYAVVPESFLRRYDEMRSANDLLALLATGGILILVVAGAVALRAYSRRELVRWREAMRVGAVIGVLVAATALNQLSSSWYGYDTATSPVVFQVIGASGAVLLGALTAVVVGLTLAAGEALTRTAFPQHVDWWRVWSHRGTREVAHQVTGGYTVAAIAFAYVAVFYVVTREAFGWWVPSALLDEPNLIATPMPWLAGITLSLQAAVWEEALFRAVPLSIIAVWAAGRPRRSLWLAGGVVLTALIFGFAHANYPSWPPYSRGVEIFLDACFWAVLFIHFGLLVTVIAHFVYDLVLFGLFAAAGSAFEYRITAMVTILALLAPALAVAWRWIRQRGFVPMPDEARFGAWVPPVREPVIMPAVEQPTWRPRVLSEGRLRAAIALGAVAAVTVLIVPPRPTLGPPFTVDRDRAVALADAQLRERGVDPAPFTRLSTTATDTLAAWRRFVREHDIAPLARDLATSYAIPTWWTVRYVRTLGDLADRTEEWRVRLLPNGERIDVRHVLAEDTQRDSIGPAGARRLAAGEIARAGIDTSVLVEARFEETARPARRDVTITYTDTAVRLPAGAAARVRAVLAGDEVLVVRRSMELPEAFLRADRSRQVRNTALLGAAALIALGLVLAGATLVSRRNAPVLHDRITRRTGIALIFGLAALALAQALNGLPNQLFSWDTATTWSNFLGQTLIALAFSVVSVLLVALLWLAVNAARRRVGIPIVSNGGDSSRLPAFVIAGLGLAASFVLASRIGALGSPAVPGPPSTILDMALPLLTEALEVPYTAAVLVPVVALPALVISASLARRGLPRVLLAVLVLSAVTTLVLSSERLREFPVVGVAALIGLATAIVLAVRAWGGLSITAWIAAALAYSAFSALGGAVHAPTTTERLASVAAVVVCAALVAFIARQGSRFVDASPAA